MNSNVSDVSIRRSLSCRSPLAGTALAVLLYAGCTVQSTRDVGPGGFSNEGLQKVTEVMQAAVDRGAVGGVVTLLYRRGEIAQVNTLGWQDPATKTPMTRDSIFRIASMTKPIAAVATLILLDDRNGPIGAYLSE